MQAASSVAISPLARLVPRAVQAICLKRIYSPLLQPSHSPRLSQTLRKQFRSTQCRSAARTLGMSIAVSGSNAANTTSAAGGSAQLWDRLQHVYNTALANGDVFKTDTDDKVFQDSILNVGFVLRVAAALNSKPKAAEPNSRQGNDTLLLQQCHPRNAVCGMSMRTLCACCSSGKPANPFLPYDEALWVAHLSDTHACLLNKFNVVAHHVLVVTRTFERQTEPLNAADFDATLRLLQVGSKGWRQCCCLFATLQSERHFARVLSPSATKCPHSVLQAMPHGGIAYYNCGPESGASQPHKHLQVLQPDLSSGVMITKSCEDGLDNCCPFAGGAIATDGWVASQATI
jgi:Ap4A phosphorylase N-terminal domain